MWMVPERTESTAVATSAAQAADATKPPEAEQWPGPSRLCRGMLGAAAALAAIAALAALMVLLARQRRP
jgi:hypothetical protein